MVGMIVTSGQLGVSGFQGNAFFASNCCRNSKSLSGFSLRRRPGSGVELKVKNGNVRRGRAFRAVLKGGSDGKSVGGAILEKEFEFKPSFGEYLKVMESVKTTRHNGSERDDSRQSSLVGLNEEDVELSVSEGNKSMVVEKDESVKSGDVLKRKERKTAKVVEMRARFDDEERNSVVKAKWRTGKHNAADNLSGISLVDGNEKDVKLSVSEEIMKKGNELTDIGIDGSVSSRDVWKKKERKSTNVVEMKVSFGHEERNSVVKEKWRPGKYNSADNFMGISLVDRNEKDVKLSVSEENMKKGNKLTAIGIDGSVKSGDVWKKKERKTTKIFEMEASFNDEERSSVVKDKWRPRKDAAVPIWLKQRTFVEEEEEEYIDDYNKKMRMENGHKASSSGMFEKKRIDDRKWERMDDQINKSREGFESRDRDSTFVKQRILNRRNEDSVDKNSDGERAAFRHLRDEVDVLMDGKRRPRVEMDERIQKLAKSLNGADVDIPEWMFAKMMRSAQIIFTDHSISRVIQILGQYGNWRRVLQVIEWLQIRERYQSHKLRFVYTTALCVLGKARRPVEALNVFNAMLQQMSSYPDIVAYHSIAVTLGQAGNMKELFDVIDIMRSPPKKKFNTGVFRDWDPRLEPDIIVYNAVLNACVQRKQWEGAFWVLQQMKENGLAPSVTTYGLTMEVMFACGKYNLVHDFFKKVQKLSIPNALTYRVLVNTLWKEGKLNEAVQAVKDMEKRGIVGSAGLYYDFARCLCSAGRSRDALAQVEKICKVANKPLVVTYTGLVQACLDSGNIEDGEYIFNYMKDFCAPNLVTCNIMLKGYLKHGMFERGKELFMEMVEGRSRVKSSVDHKVLAAPDIYTYNTVLEACVSDKRWDDFEEVYRMMLRNGYNFNPRRHLQMILDASRVGKGALLDITWSHLVDSDRSPPSALVKQWFCTKLEEEDYALALSRICNQNLAESSEFSQKAWSKLLEENSVMFREGTIVRLVQEITNITSRSDQFSPLLNNLLASCTELSRTSLVTHC